MLSKHNFVSSDFNYNISASYSSENRGVTLIEIMLATFILAMSLIPIFGILTGNVKNTDSTLTRSFAINYAKSVLNTMLNDVPFSDIQPGVPAIVSDASKAKIKALFPGGTPLAGGIACSAIATDSRGVYYQIFLRSDAVTDPSKGYTKGEFYFSYYPNPAVENQPGWDALQKQATVTENINNLPSKYTKASGLLSPYRYYGPTVTSNRWGPAEEAAGNIIHQDQREIASPDSSGNYYLMQRFILQIRWNTDPKYYKTPSTDKGHPVKLQIVTFKANLDT